MATLKQRANAADDRGTWEDFSTETKVDPATNKPKRVVTRLRIRAVPIDIRRKFERKHKLNLVRPGQPIDLMHRVAFIRDCADYALTESENLTIEAVDEGAAAALAERLGIPVEEGQEVLLDPHLEKIRFQILIDYPDMAAWVNEDALRKARVKAAEREELEEGNE